MHRPQRVGERESWDEFILYRPRDASLGNRKLGNRLKERMVIGTVE